MTLRCYLFAKSMNFTFIIFFLCMLAERRYSVRYKWGWDQMLTNWPNRRYQQCDKTYHMKSKTDVQNYLPWYELSWMSLWNLRRRQTYLLFNYYCREFCKTTRIFFSLRPSLCVSQNSATLSQPSNLLLWPFVIIVDLTEHQTTAQWSFLSGNFFLVNYR